MHVVKALPKQNHMSQLIRKGSVLRRLFAIVEACAHAETLCIGYSIPVVY
jgi:hypothetical protein